MDGIVRIRHFLDPWAIRVWLEFIRFEKLGIVLVIDGIRVQLAFAVLLIAICRDGGDGTRVQST